MGWTLLLTLAVLGSCYSNGVYAQCSTDGDCQSVCGTCDNSNSVCTPPICKEGYKCNATTGECQKPCKFASDCPSPCYSCPDDYCVSYTCPEDLQCWIESLTTKISKCKCTAASCDKKCKPQQENACCSADGLTCNCCTQDQNCYKSTSQQRATSTWEHRMLRMEKGRVVTARTCQNLCTENPEVCAKDNCEKCVTDQSDSNDPKRKVCLPCSLTQNCNSGENACCTECGCVCCADGQVCTDKSCRKLCTDEDSSMCDNCEECQTDPNDSTRKLCTPCAAIKKCKNACCTESGCVCCDAGQTCKDKSCQCDDASCSALCGTCDGATCTIPVCVEGTTCKWEPSGGVYLCH